MYLCSNKGKKKSSIRRIFTVSHISFTLTLARSLSADSLNLTFACLVCNFLQYCYFLLQPPFFFFISFHFTLWIECAKVYDRDSYVYFSIVLLRTKQWLVCVLKQTSRIWKINCYSDTFVQWKSLNHLLTLVVFFSWFDVSSQDANHPFYSIFVCLSFFWLRILS